MTEQTSPPVQGSQPPTPPEATKADTTAEAAPVQAITGGELQHTSDGRPLLFEAPKGTEESGAFAVYDRTEGRYVTEVYRGDGAKAKAAKAAKGGHLVVVEV